MKNGYAHMVQDDYVARVRRLLAERRARLAGVRTLEDARAYQAYVQRAIDAAFAPRPPRTALNARVTATRQRDGYRIENLLFESRPGLLVSANLYVPEGLQASAPAVLATCGHSDNGKALSTYQEFCLRLVHAGFVVLIYDPLNQGERDQYALLEQHDCVANCCAAHNMMGKQLELVGENLSMWRAWDGIRALDYLLTRPEVDARHVGLTGNSGGGTMTTWIWPIERRLTMAAPSCFVTSFLNNLENELPADCEQYPPGLLGAGLDMADMFIARAPDPAILLGQRYDYFDRRGFAQAAEEVQRFYALLGASERFASYLGPRPHGYGRENQEAMVAFFARQAGLPEPEPLDDPAVEEDAALWATPGGQVVHAGATPIYRLIAARADELAATRPALAPEALRATLTRLLSLPAARGIPHHRNLRPTNGANGVTYGRYAIETEGDIRAILYRRMLEPSILGALEVPEETHLYLPHLASAEDLVDAPYAVALQQERELYALDVRGLGESAPDEEGSFWQCYGMDYMHHGHGVLLDESYLGRRVYDVLRTLDLLAALGARTLHLHGRGQGALLALYAAVLHPRVTHCTLVNAPASYRAWCEAPLVAWPSANFVRKGLAHFDLPDLLAVLGDRVSVIDPWGPEMA